MKRNKNRLMKVIRRKKKKERKGTVGSGTKEDRIKAFSRKRREIRKSRRANNNK